LTLPGNLSNIFAIKQKSYKMVLILSLLDEMNSSHQQEVSITAVTTRFLKQLQQREIAGLKVDTPPTNIGTRWELIQARQLSSLIRTPIQALSSVLHVDPDKQILQFNDGIKRSWSDSIEYELRSYAMSQLEEYYNKMEQSIPLHDHLLKIMQQYPSAKRESFSNNPLGHFVRQTIPQELKKLPFIDDHYKVQGSVGMGNWATIPWIAIMDKRITDTTQQGEYIVYLFSENMESVYLTLMQGVTVPLKEKGKSEGYSYLQHKVNELRDKLPLEGMLKDQHINLTNGGLGKDYQVSTVAYYRYDRDQLPSSEQLIADLRNVVENYRLYVDSQEHSEAENDVSFKYTIAHLYYGQGIVKYLSQSSVGSATIEELAANQSTVLMTGEQVKHPKERARHICRALEELGLLAISNQHVTISEFGNHYAQHFDNSIWRISDKQVDLLRHRIETHHPASPLISVIRQSISICEQLNTFTFDAFQTQFIDALQVQNEWNDVTRRNRATFMLNWLEDLHYITKSGGVYTSSGTNEVGQLDNLSIQERIEIIKEFIVSKGFVYPDNLIENFYLSLKSKPFVILAGVSGTGKTKLVKLFAEALGATSRNRQFTLIPVRPDWSDPSDLLGYKDLSGVFRPGLITEVLVEASKPENQHKPYFICLDEMNLARVEHYFSDMLSILETQQWQSDRLVTDPLIKADSLTTDEDKQTYGNLYLPDNVYLIGTVNMDETTHPFSKKVLDRANTIEFNYINLGQYPSLEATSTDRAIVPTKNQFLRAEYIQLVDAYSDYRELVEKWTNELVKINSILEEIHSHVGFRIRDAVCFYMIYNEQFELMDQDAAFDQQLLQKILPRIQGSNTSVKRVLLQLAQIALGRKLNIEEMLEDASSLYSGQATTGTEKYPNSARKIAFMLRRLEEDGFTSYWLS
jgi:GTPase subunit of restriction endonuclease